MLKVTNQVVNKSSQVAFKGFVFGKNNYMSDNLDISDKTVTSASVSNGNINLDNARVLRNVTSLNGNINSDFSTVDGDVLNTNGNTKLRNSHIGGSVLATNGNLRIDQTDINGDVETLNGNTGIANSKVKGKITSLVDTLKLSGQNELNKVVLKNPDNAVMTIYNNGKNIHINSFSSQVIIVNGKVISGSSENIPAKAPEFTVPSGTRIQDLIFESKKKGVVLLEEGAEIVGKIVNGTIKHIKR